MRNGVPAAVLMGLVFAGAGGVSRTAAAVAQVATAAPDEVAAKVRAEKADEVWLALVDSAKWAESWKEASAAFQKAVPEQTWMTGVAHVREPLGKLLHRELLSATFSRELPGAPDGQYVVSQYHTSFANKAEAMETVVTQVEADGSWRISGYYVK